MDELYLNKDFTYTVVWAHLTILLYLLYKKIYFAILNYNYGESGEETDTDDDESSDKEFKDDIINLIRRENRGTEGSKKELNTDSSPTAEVNKSANNVTNNFEKYLLCLGKDIFGKMIAIDKDEYINDDDDDYKSSMKSVNMSLNDISNMRPLDKHNLCIELILENEELFGKLYNYKYPFRYEIKNDITNSDLMDLYLFKIIGDIKSNFKNMVSNQLTDMFGSNIMGGVLEFATHMTSRLYQEPPNEEISNGISHGISHNISSKSNITVELMDEIEREMALLEGTENKSDLEKEMELLRQEKPKDPHM